MSQKDAAYVPPRGAACYWYCCGKEIARGDRVGDPKAIVKIQQHRKEAHQ